MSGLEKDKLFLTLRNLKSSNKAITFYTEQNKKINSYLDKKSDKLFLNKIFERKYLNLLSLKDLKILVLSSIDILSQKINSQF